VRNLLHSGKRPDLAILGALCNIITGVRTVVGADPRYCAAAALFPGHGAVWGATRKNGAWLDHTMPQGDAFFALCHEAGGHMGDFAYDFLGMITDSAGESASGRMAFKVYAFQRLHAANFRGVAAVINSRPVIRTGPGAPPGCGLQPLGTACPKPVISFRSHGGIARQAIVSLSVSTTNNSNFAAVCLTSGT